MTTTEITGKSVAAHLSRLQNISADAQLNEFIEEIVFDHRTLQQKSIGTLLSVILKAAELADEGRTDARNEASALTCQRIRDLLNTLEDECVIPLLIRDGRVTFPHI